MVMAASSARLIACLFGLDLISICVMVYLVSFTMVYYGFTMAPIVGLPVTRDPAV